ncbi:MAG: molybdopterin molybdotransferase MoeA [Sporomusaceae bacterium]|jgi:molybdopterin molybdotransferase|nr:molybdopterin molybdotransferase MoeA [Sporomusaceae bacterium]
MEFFNCVSLPDAYALLKKELSQLNLGAEKIALTDSLDRISAADIFAAEDLPPFNRSTVDGFAVFSQDTFGAGETSPALFSVAGEVLMGQEVTWRVHSGQAAAVPTGAMLPEGLDAVVMLENTERPDKDTLLVFHPAAPLENVVSAGEDVKKGELILGAGKSITPAVIGILAACGICTVSVRPQIKVGIISTGDEIIDISQKPTGGQIRDVNSYALAAMLQEAQLNCQVFSYGIIKDEYEDLKRVLKKAAAENDLVLISGGSSVGARDYTVQVIEELGERKVLFHGLAMKPGKPTIVGRAKNALVFGLPGHPVAAMTVCAQLVKFAVRILLGQAEKAKFSVTATLTRNIASAPGRDDFFRVKLKEADGKYFAEPLLGKSGLISTMAGADGLIHVDAATTGLYTAEEVQVELL